MFGEDVGSKADFCASATAPASPKAPTVGAPNTRHPWCNPKSAFTLSLGFELPESPYGRVYGVLRRKYPTRQGY